MPMFETSSLDIGVVNSLPSSGVGGQALPATVHTGAAVNNSGTNVGQKVVITGAMEDVEYAVSSPGFQINGSTQATGSYQITFTFFEQDGSTAIGTVVTPSVPCSQTVNGQIVGTVYTARLAVPSVPSATPFVTQTASPNLSGATISVPAAPHSVQASLVVTGAAGQLTAGWTLGGHRRNRAG